MVHFKAAQPCENVCRNNVTVISKHVLAANTRHVDRSPPRGPRGLKIRARLRRCLAFRLPNRSPGGPPDTSTEQVPDIT